MRDPWSGYDAWLTTDRMGEAQERASELLEHHWETWCDWLSDEHTLQVPYAAEEEDHPDHAIYVAFEALMNLVVARNNRLEDEAMAEMYGDADERYGPDEG